MNIDKSNPFYREIESHNPVTLAESTISWFYSGKKQPLIDVVTKYPVLADGIFDCTRQLQAACDDLNVYIPKGTYSTKQTKKT